MPGILFSVIERMQLHATRTVHGAYVRLSVRRGVSAMRRGTVRLYELEEYDLSVVALARAQLEDPCVSALTVGVLRSDFLK